MHICFITHEFPKKGYPHGGIGSFIKTISMAFVENGHQVSVIGINNYTNNFEEENVDSVAVYRLKPKKVKGLTWYFNSKRLNGFLKSLHKKQPINIIETPELGLAFLNKIPSVRYVIRLHGGHHFFSEAEKRKINKWKGFQEQRSFKKADGFIAVSNYVKSHTNNYLDYNNKPIEVISSPINLDVFKPNYDIQVDENLLLFAGTVCEKKGIRHLVLAMEHVVKEFPNVRLEIYGRDWFFKNGDSYIDYLNYTVLKDFDESIKTAIEFKGVVSLLELSKKYAEAAVCVFPSLMETQGLVAQEAMAMEKLVVFSELGPGTECITHKDTGLLCNPNEIESISNAIIWALNNTNETKAIAEKGKNFIHENYNISTLLKKNINFYKSL